MTTNRGTLSVGLMLALGLGCNQAQLPNVDPDPKTVPDPIPDPDPKPDPDPVIPPPVVPVGTTPIAGADNCEIDLLSPPQVYGSKVKTLLTGKPLTAAEVERLEGDPEQLGDMIDTWFADPVADQMLRHFFEMAFQQNQVTEEGLTTMLGVNNTNWGRYDGSRESVVELMTRNIQESFARTALRIVRDGRPFSDVVTTRTFEMTTALMTFYAYLDHRHLQEDDRFFTRPMNEVSAFVGLRNRADEGTAEDILNPNSPDFMRYWLPTFDELCLPTQDTEFPFAPNAINNKVHFVFMMMLGRAENVRNVGAGNQCRARPRTRQPLLSLSDFSDWRPVTIRQPSFVGETPVRFYRLPQMRRANELVVHVERVGFFTTLGFFGTWPTNEDNSSRVTLNQTLITALGKSFDGTIVVDFEPPNLDEEHSAPGSACYSCHQTLDPMREFMRQSYTWAYGEQHDQARISAPAHFVFRGVEATGNGVGDLADIVSRHPDFAEGWVQKLCAYANAGRCEKSAELDAVVAGFARNHDFGAMTRALLSSPLVTNAVCVDEKTGRGPSIARRDQFCSQLSNRLGIDDVCGQDTVTQSRSVLQAQVLGAVSSVPVDTFSRGENDHITISDTGLFTRATREVVCTIVGERAYDAAFTGLSRPDAIEKMVTEVMGLSAVDARHEGAREILDDHVTDAVDSGASLRNGLRSALAIACMSPGMSGIGF